MSVWSAKRRFLYGGSFILALILVGAGVFWRVFYHAPTCSDNTKNGNETGIDCGGNCLKICTPDALKPVVLWAKIFNISGDLYTAVAFVQNPNINSKNPSAEYHFSIFDENGKLVTVRDGKTSVPKNKKFAVFETGIVLKNQKPKSADLVFTSFSPWEKDTSSEPKISLIYSELFATTTSPKITGTISNASLVNIPQVELVAFVLDNNENAIGASRTFADNLGSKTSQDFVFTWPTAFLKEVSVVTVMYRFP